MSQISEGPIFDDVNYRANGIINFILIGHNYGIYACFHFFIQLTTAPISLPESDVWSFARQIAVGMVN